MSELRRTVTIYVPDGYDSVDELLSDCQFEVADDEIEILRDQVKATEELSASWSRDNASLRAQLANARKALKIYADDANWRLGQCCDPNSHNFEGSAIARAALSDDQRGDQ